MDELDIKILYALISERAVSPSNPSVKLSLRAIVAHLGADDMMVRYRYNRMQESCWMSVWSLLVNPTFFNYRVTDLLVDVQPESKPDIIRKLKLVHEITGMVNFYGSGLKDLLDVQWRRISFLDGRANLRRYKRRKNLTMSNASSEERDDEFEPNGCGDNSRVV